MGKNHMRKRHCLELPEPAESFMDSFLLGNGRLGATVRSGIGEERIDLNLDRFWSGGPSTGFAEPSSAHLLPDLREALGRGDSATADALSQRMQGRGWTQSYQPLSGLRFRFDTSTEAHSYTRCLDLARATARHEYESAVGNATITSFVSGPRNVAVTIAQGENLLPLEAMQVHWDCPHPSDTHAWVEGGTYFFRISGRAPICVIPPYVDVETPVTYADDQPDADGTVAAGMGFSIVAALQSVTGGARLLIAAACGFRGWNRRPSADLDALQAEAESTLRASLLLSWPDLHAESVADHRTYFDRNDLELPHRPERGQMDPAQAELLYHFGRYLLISSSRPDTEPANLQGIWNTHPRPPWSSNHTTNINTEMNYWPAQATGLGDLAAPLVDMTEQLIQAGRDAARHYYGAPGSVVHHNTDLWRFSQPVQGGPMWANWTGALPWLIAHSWDHWEGGVADAAFARERLLPMMAEVVRFALFMLVADEAGNLVVSPSSSPEQCYVGPDNKPWGVTQGSTMDQVLYRQLFERFIILSTLLHAETDLAEEARTALTRLREPPTDADGALCEWSAGHRGADPGHRHFSHLYGLYPGGNPARYADPASVRSARLALDHRLAHSTERPGWSQSWILCMAARLGDAHLAQKSIAVLLTELTTNSLLVLHPYAGVPGNAIFQIDGNFGATAGILEMIVQSTSDTVLLLPSVPDDWNRGRVEGVHVRGGHVVSVSWEDKVVTHASLNARSNGPLCLDVPIGGQYEITCQSSPQPCQTTTASDPSAGRQRLIWSAVTGETYRVARL